jgi:hypothetical protein
MNDDISKSFSEKSISYETIERTTQNMLYSARKYSSAWRGEIRHASFILKNITPGENFDGP